MEGGSDGVPCLTSGDTAEPLLIPTCCPYLSLIESSPSTPSHFHFLLFSIFHVEMGIVSKVLSTLSYKFWGISLTFKNLASHIQDGRKITL
jgi:hypothetical protein